MLKRGGTTDISLAYTYDEAERLNTVKRGSATIATYEYDKNGNRTKLTYPQNNVEHQYVYNRANLLTGLAHLKNGLQFAGETYGYTVDGNQTTKSWGGGRTAKYTYDRLGRLAKEEDVGRRTVSYAFDRFGNRTKLTVAGVRNMGEESWSTVYTYDANNRLLTEVKTDDESTESTKYAYDRNGNQIRKEWTREETDRHVRGSIGFAKLPHGGGRNCLDIRAYNANNQLVQVARDGLKTEYAYRPDGLRHSKTVANAQNQKTTATYIWNGANLVEELNGSTVKARYLRGSGLISQLIDANTFYYLLNGHGDVVQRADQSGNLGTAYEYDAFGVELKNYNVVWQPTDGLETDPNPFRYCGEYYDLETNEYYLRNRSYYPLSGRFTSEDPARAQGNWYAYCNGSPIKYCDPSGLRYDDGPVQNAYEQKKNLPITSSAYNGKANSVFTTYIPPTKNPSLPPASPIYTPAPPAPPAWAPPPALNTPTTTEFLDFGNYQNNLSVPFYDPINGQGRNDSRAPQIRMGLFNGSKNGCSWIATFNAVRLSGGYVHPADIIQYYEGNLNFFGGLGVGPERVHDFLQQQGYNTTFDKYYVYSSGTSDFDTNMNVGDVMILEYFASGGIGMHYVAIEAISATTGGIEYLVYNEYNDSASASTYPSIDAWILQQEHIPYAAIGFQ